MKKKFIISLVMAITVVITSFSTMGSIVNQNTLVNDNYDVLIRVKNIDDSILPRYAEIIGFHSFDEIDVLIPYNFIDDLGDKGFDFDIIDSDIDRSMILNSGDYHSFEEMEQMLQDTSDDYPSIVDLTSIGKSYEGRDVWCIEISDNPGVDEDEAGVFFMGLHHAREWPSLEICLHIIEKLTSDYGSVPEVTDIVDNRRIWIVPCVNPDGYYYCHDQGVDWRKNRHYFEEFDTYGVDLNRNYAGSSNGDALGAWGSLGESSVTHDYSSSVYCGPSAFSEYETQYVRDFFIDNDICASISWHTYGELVMWPWGYDDEAVAPDDSFLEYIGIGIAEKIDRQSGTGTYTPYKASSLYPTTGDTCDWAYGYSHYVLGRTTFAYTIEACASFHPPAHNLDQIVSENYDGAFYLLQQADIIKDSTVPRVSQPLIDVNVMQDGDFVVSWDVLNPESEPDFYQLDEVIDLSFEIDDAEIDSGLWDIDGFTRCDDRKHTGDFSYYSGLKNEIVHSITSKYPLPVTNDMMLSFWCWYDTEVKYDYAMVEVSTNGRNYDVLDKFNGVSDGWELKQYSLDDYAGKSVYIRFRYTTDQNTIEEGFYVDDISPLALIDDVNTISDSLIETSYDFSDKPDGIYYYQVRGYNDEHGWCDFSVLKRVEIGDNTAPDAPLITGPSKGNADVTHTFEFSSVDFEGHQLYYYIDWGDGSDLLEWVGPYDSGEVVEFQHKFDKGSFTVKAKVRDELNYESPYSLFETAMPRSVFSGPFIFKFERFLSVLIDFYQMFS